MDRYGDNFYLLLNSCNNETNLTFDSNNDVLVALYWLFEVRASGNLKAFLEANNLQWLGSSGGFQSGQTVGVAKDLLDLEEPDVYSGDLLDLEAPALADNLVIHDDSDEESDEESSDDDEDEDDSDGEEEIEACLIEL